MKIALNTLAKIVSEIIRTRSGETVTKELALERANNIAQALAGMEIEE